MPRSLSPSPTALLLVAALAWTAAGSGDTRAAAQDAADPCAEAAGPGGRGNGDLYCIELLPAMDIDSGAGTARLLPPASPFGVAATAAGEQQYDIEFNLRNLPDPSTVGPYTAYVAWATTPQLSPLLKLGAVRNGTIRLGRVTFDRLLILISAEASADVSDRAGRLVLRGTSAAVRMQPHDLAYVLSGFLQSTGAAPAEHVHDARGSGAAPGAWTPPPMHPRISMPPELMTLRPDVSSYLPRQGQSAPLARPRELLRLADGAAVRLVAAPVRRVLFGRTVTMLGFNGQYPGPLIQVNEGSTIVVRFTNRTDFPTAVHWHVSHRRARRDRHADGLRRDAVMTLRKETSC